MSSPGDSVGINPETAYEPSDWRISAIAIVMAMLLVVLAVAVLALRLAFRTAASDVDRRLTTVMPAPVLQTDPRQDLARLRAREEETLSTYYWVDRPNGIVHIPVEQAMKLVARGLDGFPKGQP